MPLFRPTICEIDLASLRHNYRELKLRAGVGEVMSIVKANAYGHGAPAVARTLVQEGSTVLGVSSIEEGIELRKAGIQVPILCLGGSLGAARDDLLEYQITPVLFNEDEIHHLARKGSNSKSVLDFHLKVDTGMGRLGIFPQQLPYFLKLIEGYPNLKLKGILSHFAKADEADPSFTREQIHRFDLLKHAVLQSGLSLPVYHIANSAALLDGQLHHCDWVRPGIALYGSYPHPRYINEINLQPVLTWKTSIISLKEFPKDSPLSYSGTFKTKRTSQIAVLPVGYADGYSRKLSNRGEVLIREKRVPVVGRVCMDLTLIDVTDLPNIQLGEEVVLLGKQESQCIRAEEIADWIGTISYEIFCSISSRVPRLVLSSGEKI